VCRRRMWRLWKTRKRRHRSRTEIGWFLVHVYISSEFSQSCRRAYRQLLSGTLQNTEVHYTTWEVDPIRDKEIKQENLRDKVRSV